MRLWSIHPKYLDSKGLVSLWREALLAKNVLENKTKGYKNHPQLNRFKSQNDPIDALNIYLSQIFEESSKRNFNFNKNKFEMINKKIKIPVTNKQIQFEFNHLLNKLKHRDHNKYNEIKNTKKIETFPIFTEIDGEIEEWENF